MPKFMNLFKKLADEVVTIHQLKIIITTVKISRRGLNSVGSIWGSMNYMQNDVSVSVGMPRK